MIDLRRRDGDPVLRIGHRGAASLAPENTLRSLRAAVDLGVDLVEFDVLDLRRGPLVLAHSDHLDEVSHGVATGSVRARSLEELREVAPELPTFDEALAYFADEARDVGLHVDLKLTTRLDELCAALERFGLVGRTVVSSTHVASLREVARHAPPCGWVSPSPRIVWVSRAGRCSSRSSGAGSPLPARSLRGSFRGWWRGRARAC